MLPLFQSTGSNEAFEKKKRQQYQNGWNFKRKSMLKKIVVYSNRNDIKFLIADATLRLELLQLWFLVE
jgi:hypothetical protein